MKKRIFTLGFIALALISLVMGYSMNSHYRRDLLQKPQKTVTKMQANEVVTPDTRIIYEKEYQRCHHTIISGFDNKARIMGWDAGALKQGFKKNDGYSISFRDNTLVIHQLVNELCPQDQGQFKLKEYNGLIAVYTGAEENEILLRVTAIKLKLLPPAVQQDIRSGKYIFDNEAKLNDTLENLDEYL